MGECAVVGAGGVVCGWVDIVFGSYPRCAGMFSVKGRGKFDE